MPAPPLFVTMGDSAPPPSLARSALIASTIAETLAPAQVVNREQSYQNFADASLASGSSSWHHRGHNQTASYNPSSLPHVVCQERAPDHELYTGAARVQVHKRAADRPEGG